MCGCLSSAPLLGTWPATQACALLGIDPGTLWSAGWCLIHGATPARAHLIFNGNFWGVRIGPSSLEEAQEVTSVQELLPLLSLGAAGAWPWGRLPARPQDTLVPGSGQGAGSERGHARRRLWRERPRKEAELKGESGARRSPPWEKAGCQDTVGQRLLK